ncbi:MAG: apiosidase-like domain-containing protein [Armatimonadota bacterium]
MQSITQNLVHEWAFTSEKQYLDPFNEITLDVLFTARSGSEMLVPAFWARNSNWKVRFSSPETESFQYKTICSDTDNGDLHGVSGEFIVTPYTGDNPLYTHGPVRIASDRHHFEHNDGTPFFWLADTWWMGLCKRLDWPRGFLTLAMDRVEKGFSVIQIVAGLYPDMPGFDERGANEAGYPWEDDFSCINPAYFDYADRRISYMTDSGLAPCIVGCWGYYLKLLGIDKMKQHWRYLIARYGAYPVFWCLAGEAAMPFYMSDTKEADAEFQIAGWTEIAKYVHGIDPFKRPVTIHPTQEGRDQVLDPSVIDFEMLQTGHGDRASAKMTVDTVVKAVNRKPEMPVIDAEVCYEGIGESCRQEVQRFMFWACMLNGTAGHTYGANGIWQVNTKERPYGPSPHGLAWGNTPWDEAAQLPGSKHLGIGKKFLEGYRWWNFEPHLEWVEGPWSPDNYFGAYAAGIPGKIRMIYWPSAFMAGIIKNVEQDIPYKATLFNPVTGETTDLGSVMPDSDGNWTLPLGNPPWNVMPIYQDWVLVMEA